MLKLVRDYIGKYRGYAIATIIVTILSYALQIAFLFPESKRIIDEGVYNMDFSAIYSSGIKMLILSVAIGVCMIFQAYFSAKATAGFTKALHRACFVKVNSLTPQEFASFGESTLVSRTMADVTQMRQMMINGLRLWLIVPVIIILELVMIATMDLTIFFILLGVTIVAFSFLVIFGAKSRSFFERVQAYLDRTNRLMKEKLTGVRAIRAFSNEKLVNEKMEGVFEEAREVSLEANKRIVFLAPIALVIMNLVVVLIYLVGAVETREGLSSISSLLLIFQYISYFVLALGAIPFLVTMFPKGVVSAERINELLDFKSLSKEGKELKNEAFGEVCFKNVIFGYQGASDVVANISFTASPGKVTAFIGTTGSGKTTIMNLMQGLYQPTFGDILIDGENIRDISRQSLSRVFSYATQRPMIFSDTVKANIASDGDNISEERIKEALSASCFDEVIKDKKEGINFKVTQGGMNLSGGQRQRLSLARTFSKDALIYVIDDSFSALDAKTEQKVLNGMRKLLKGKTIIMVAQKIDTIKDADNIIVMDKGRIAGQGRHEELLNSCGVYRDIYDTQCYLEEGE